MVSEKVIVVLFVAAILLSVLSVIITLASVNMGMVPTNATAPQAKASKTTDAQQAQVSIIIEPQPEGENASTQNENK